MSNPFGYVLAGAVIGLESVLIRPRRGMGPLVAQVTIEESHKDELEITDHPVEQGASITDHSFKRPAEVTIICGWSNSPGGGGAIAGLPGGVQAGLFGIQSALQGANISQVKEVYQKLLKLQADRIPFDVYTGKRVYSNMLLRSLQVHTDKASENSLAVTAVCRQIIMVSTQTVNISSAPASEQQSPESTMPTTNSGTKRLLPAPYYIGSGG